MTQFDVEFFFIILNKNNRRPRFIVPDINLGN